MLSLMVLASTAAGEIPGPLQTRVHAAALDPQAFAEWCAGKEAPVVDEQFKNGPHDVIWTTDKRPNGRWVPFGQENVAGPRHLRIGFRRPVEVGAVLVRGGGRLSVLKERVAYPGDLGEDRQWTPAERIVDRSVTTDEVTHDEYAVWVLPRGTRTRALRFTHEAGPSDPKPAGRLGGVWVFSERLVNFAPQAIVTASARPEAARCVVDRMTNGWKTWDNGPKGAPSPVVGERAEWLILAWPRKVELEGLCLLWIGFSAAEIEVFTGPDDQSPAAAAAASWRSVSRREKLDSWYTYQLGPNWFPFDGSIETRAVRLRATATVEEDHPHLIGKTAEGRRIWLGELMALGQLENKRLSAALPPEQEQPPPPIPVRFQLPEAGLVTLVIEDAEGRRVRNLASETPFPAGDNVAWWDGSDDLGRDVDAARHGLYHIPTQFVPPGRYTVRGLWRKPLKLSYEFSVYDAGQPPWMTPDTTGGWMANHTPPSSLASVPGSRTSAGQPLVFMGSFISEGTHGLQWTREDGTKLGGQDWIGGTWTGAATLAVDGGSRANREHLCYTGSVANGDELRICAKTPSFADKEIVKLKLDGATWPEADPPAEKPEPLDGFDGGGARYVLAGIAAYDRLLVASFVRQNSLLVFHTDDGRLLGNVAVENPRGVAFDREGRLLVLSGTRLLRLEAANLPETGPSVDVGLDWLQDPRHVTVDERGNFYVSDRGNSHQVKVYSSEGRPLRGIGTCGPPAIGPYDPMHMNNPNGLAIDSQGRLWVAESDCSPKRVSVWSPDGRLVRAFYGPSEYGGGGVLDPCDKRRFYYRGMEFQLDWTKGEDRLVRVFWRPEELFKYRNDHYSPDTPLYPDAADPATRYFHLLLHAERHKRRSGHVPLARWPPRGPFSGRDRRGPPVADPPVRAVSCLLAGRRTSRGRWFGEVRHVFVERRRRRRAAPAGRGSHRRGPFGRADHDERLGGRLRLARRPGRAASPLRLHEVRRPHL